MLGSLSFRGALLALLGNQAAAVVLYAASYSGDVTSLSLTLGGSNGSAATLEALASHDGCTSSPSWLTLDSENGVLYCTNEGFATWPNGTIVAFSTLEDGSLELLDAEETLVGAVSSVFYGGPEYKGLAVAYYGGSGFATFDVAEPANLTKLTAEVFELAEPGPNPDRQEAPHPHQVVVDPTGGFILAPDLGADLVRIYAVGEGLTVAAQEPLAVPPGSGPRHAAFAVHGESTYLYVVNELANTLLGYAVSYGASSISFEQIHESGTHGEGVEVPEFAAAAEIVVSPDQNFLIVSSRNESAFEIPNFDPSNTTAIVSDTLINFSIDPASGALTTLQEVPSGGRYPRQFSLNADGTLLAAGLQSDGRVVVISRDPATGQLGDFLASAPVEGEVTAVIFRE